MFLRCFLLVMVAASLLLAGCSRYSEQTDAEQISLGREDADYMVVIALDLSGSFADKMAREGKAYEFTTRVVDKYFRNSIGSNNRIVIAELSATNRPLLWDGTPVQLR